MDFGASGNALKSECPSLWACSSAGRAPALQARPRRLITPFLPVPFSLFSTISGNLLLARSNPRGHKNIGFWNSFGTAGPTDRWGEPPSETENLRHVSTICLPNFVLVESNCNHTNDFPQPSGRTELLSMLQGRPRRLAALNSLRTLLVDDSPRPSANGIDCSSVR